MNSQSKWTNPLRSHLTKIITVPLKPTTLSASHWQTSIIIHTNALFPHKSHNLAHYTSTKPILPFWPISTFQTPHYDVPRCAPAHRPPTRNSDTKQTGDELWLKLAGTYSFNTAVRSMRLFAVKECVPVVLQKSQRILTNAPLSCPKDSFVRGKEEQESGNCKRPLCGMWLSRWGRWEPNCTDNIRSYIAHNPTHEKDHCLVGCAQHGCRHEWLFIAGIQSQAFRGKELLFEKYLLKATKQRNSTICSEFSVPIMLKIPQLQTPISLSFIG